MAEPHPSAVTCQARLLYSSAWPATCQPSNADGSHYRARRLEIPLIPSSGVAVSPKTQNACKALPQAATRKAGPVATPDAGVQSSRACMYGGTSAILDSVFRSPA